MSKRFFILLFCLAWIGPIQGAENETAEPVRKIRGKAVFGGDVNNPVPGAKVTYRSINIYKSDPDLKTDENGDFEITIENDPMYVEVLTPDGFFGKMVIVKPTENEFVVSLEPTASVHGRVIDRRSETPPNGRNITYSINIPAGVSQFLPSFERTVKTNEKGEYEFRGLPTGVTCDVMFPTYNYGENQSPGSSWWIGRGLELKPDENRELKDFTFDSHPNGRNEYIWQVYNAYGGLNWRGYSVNLYEQRFDTLLERAKRDNKGVFAILVDQPLEENILSALVKIYETLFKDDDMFAQTERYYMMCVRMQPKEEEWRNVTAAMAQEFVKSHLIALPTPFSFAFFDPDGLLKGVEPFDHTEPPEKQKQALIEMLKKY